MGISVTTELEPIVLTREEFLATKYFGYEWQDFFFDTPESCLEYAEANIDEYSDENGNPLRVDEIKVSICEQAYPFTGYEIDKLIKYMETDIDVSLTPEGSTTDSIILASRENYSSINEAYLELNEAFRKLLKTVDKELGFTKSTSQKITVVEDF